MTSQDLADALYRSSSVRYMEAFVFLPLSHSLHEQDLHRPISSTHFNRLDLYIHYTDPARQTLTEGYDLLQIIPTVICQDLDNLNHDLSGSTSSRKYQPSYLRTQDIDDLL